MQLPLVSAICPASDEARYSFRLPPSSPSLPRLPFCLSSPRSTFLNFFWFVFAEPRSLFLRLHRAVNLCHLFPPFFHDPPRRPRGAHTFSHYLCGTVLLLFFFLVGCARVSSHMCAVLDLFTFSHFFFLLLRAAPFTLTLTDAGWGAALLLNDGWLHARRRFFYRFSSLVFSSHSLLKSPPSLSDLTLCLLLVGQLTIWASYLDLLA